MKIGDIVKYKDNLGKVVTAYLNKDILKFLPCNFGRYSSDELDTVTFDDLKETTFEEKIKFIETEYHWGKVIKTHCIGDYQIIEDDNNEFHLYIEFKDTCVSYPSIDTALIGGICRKYDGSNEQLSIYVCKALGIKID